MALQCWHGLRASLGILWWTEYRNGIWPMCIMQFCLWHIGFCIECFGDGDGGFGEIRRPHMISVYRQTPTKLACFLLFSIAYIGLPRESLLHYTAFSQFSLIKFSYFWTIHFFLLRPLGRLPFPVTSTAHCETHFIKKTGEKPFDGCQFFALITRISINCWKRQGLFLALMPWKHDWWLKLNRCILSNRVIIRPTEAKRATDATEWPSILWAMISSANNGIKRLQTIDLYSLFRRTSPYCLEKSQKISNPGPYLRI